MSRSGLFCWGIPALLLALFFAFVLWLNDLEKIPLVSRRGKSFEKGVVVEILEDNLMPDGTRSGQQRPVVEMTTGVRAGEAIEMTFASGYLFGAPCTVGMGVIVVQSVAGENTLSAVYSQDRGEVLLAFVALYLLSLCLIGGRQGEKGALGLVFTFACVLWIYLPMVYRGCSPFWTAVFVCAVTTVVTMYLIGGPTRKTAVAVGGTVAGVVIAGAVACIFSAVSGITGWNVSDIESLMTLGSAEEVQVGGLLF